MTGASADLFGGGDRVLHTALPGLVTGLEWVATAIDLFAIAVMLIGAARFALRFLRAEFAGDARMSQIDAARLALGRYILTGLEVFIVSDIIHTALSLALSDLLFLGLLVLIRSVISFFLHREIQEIAEQSRG